jgi:hypothetical protein
MKYTKEDLVEFLRWNSNAPIKIIRQTTADELENFIKNKGAWDRFIDGLEKQREARNLEKKVNQMLK